MEILHSKIVQQSRQLFITGSDHDTVKFNATVLFSLITDVISAFKDIPFTFHEFCISIA